MNLCFAGNKHLIENCYLGSKKEMDFGKVADPGKIDFTLPVDHSDTEGVLKRDKSKAKPEYYIGCAKWNKTDS
jgi:hypothetical protein